jgi:PAS domain-containing protein
LTDLDGPGPFGHSQIGQIAFEKRPYLTNAIIEDLGVSEQAWAKQEGLVAFAGYPLLINQEVVGVMAVFSRHFLTSFTWHSLGLVADRIASAIERQKVMEAHQNLARHYARILAASGEGIYELDREGKITFVNPAGAHMLGYRIEELVGEPMHELMHHTKPDGSSYPREALYNPLKSFVIPFCFSFMSMYPWRLLGRGPTKPTPSKGARTDRPPQARNGEQRSIGSRPPEDRYKANESFGRCGRF